MYKIVFNKTTKKVETVVKITKKLKKVGYNKEKYDLVEVKNIPVLSGENHSLYVENGKIVSKLDESKVARLARQALLSQIATKKALLNKYREDVEQVDLYGMERADYAEKKAVCKTLVEELRELEKELRS